MDDEKNNKLDDKLLKASAVFFIICLVVYGAINAAKPATLTTDAETIHLSDNDKAFRGLLTPKKASPVYPLYSPGPTPTGLINVNTAGQDALVTLPGVGPAKARAVIKYRREHGSFKNVDDLVKVKGIGKKTLEKIRKRVIVE